MHAVRVVAVVFAVLWLTTSVSTAAEEKSSELARQLYLGQDYLQAFETAQVKMPAEHAGYGAFTQEDIPAVPLNDAERRLLGELQIGSALISCGATAVEVIAFARKFGYIPADGVELLTQYTEHLVTPEAMEEFTSLDQLEQIQKLRFALNPATGMVYDSFTNPTWVQFGLHVEKLEGEGSTKLIPPAEMSGIEPGERVGLVEHQGWRVVVYGQSEGSVLVDKVIWWEPVNSAEAD